MNKYDVIIIGAGPSGIFCAYELMRQKPDMKASVPETHDKGLCRL